MTTRKPACLGGAPVFQEKVPMVRPTLPTFEEMAPELKGILSSGMVTKGAHLRRFEEAVADHLAVEHAVALSSCTSGLMLAYRCLGFEGEVLVPSFTFMATVSALVWAGLKPRFVDVNPATGNVDVDILEARITDRTCAIVAVHNFGNPAPIEDLEGFARERGLKLVFDSAHAFGSLYRGARVAGQGDAQVFSLSPTKLVIAGEGGIVATNNAELAEKIRIGREYGNDGNYNSAFAGLNARMPEFSALMGLRSLTRIEDEVQRRNQLAALYRKHLAEMPGLRFQVVAPGDRCSYKDCTLFIDRKDFGLSRDELATALALDNVDTRKYYDPPVHLHDAYEGYWDRQPLPSTDLLAATALSVPLWSRMEDAQVVQICEAIARIRGCRDAIRQAMATT